MHPQLKEIGFVKRLFSMGTSMNLTLTCILIILFLLCGKHLMEKLTMLV